MIHIFRFPGPLMCALWGSLRNSLSRKTQCFSKFPGNKDVLLQTAFSLKCVVFQARMTSTVVERVLSPPLL